MGWVGRDEATRAIKYGGLYMHTAAEDDEAPPGLAMGGAERRRAPMRRPAPHAALKSEQRADVRCASKLRAPGGIYIYTQLYIYMYVDL
jgi:hypothetical protein